MDFKSILSLFGNIICEKSSNLKIFMKNFSANFEQKFFKLKYESSYSFIKANH